MEISKGEIVYCNLKVVDDSKKAHEYYEFKEVVYKLTNGFYYEKRYFDKLKLKKPLKVYKLEVLARLGFENIQNN